MNYLNSTSRMQSYLLIVSSFLSAYRKVGIVAEIGVDQGEFSNHIISICEPQKLHLIDVWDSERYNTDKEMLVYDNFKEVVQQGRVEINKGYSTNILPEFDNHYFDWIYIDSDHSYATTSAELRIARDKVKQYGFICGHDYSVGNWRTHYRYGVIEAVHEFCVLYNWEIIYLTAETHQHRSFALREIRS